MGLSASGSYLRPHPSPRAPPLRVCPSSGPTHNLLSEPHTLDTLPEIHFLFLQIIQDRIWGASAHPSLMWNSPPGALLALPTFSTSLQDFPFYHLQLGMSWGSDSLR